MRKTACIVAVGVWGNKKCLLKNRDRNYTPKVKVVHDIENGVEVAYLEDLGTGWIEGMNEHSIGIVNAALMVGRDEAEKKVVKTVGKKSKDGERILKGLGSRSLDDAVDSLVHFKSGVKGHTFVADREHSKSIEMTSKHEAVVNSLKSGVTHVRTNHGFAYPDSGYTHGESYVSSVSRRNQAMRALRDVKKPEGIVPALIEHRHDDLEDPNNMVRDTENMKTTTQMVVNLTDREILLYCIDETCEWEGVDNLLPDGREPKIKLRVFDVEEKSGKIMEKKPPFKKFNSRASKEAMLAAKVASKWMRLAGVPVLMDFTLPVKNTVIDAQAMDEAGTETEGFPMYGSSLALIFKALEHTVATTTYEGFRFQVTRMVTKKEPNPKLHMTIKVVGPTEQFTEDGFKLEEVLEEVEGKLRVEIARQYTHSPIGEWFFLDARRYFEVEFL